MDQKTRRAWITAVGVITVLAMVTSALAAMSFQLPRLPGWSDPHPLELFQYTPSLVLTVVAYFVLLLGVVLLATPMRLLLRLPPHLNWASLLIALYPPLVWLLLAIKNAEGKTTANHGELLLLGLAIGLVLSLFGGWLSTWTRCIHVAWVGAVVAFMLWAFVPSLRHFPMLI